MKYLFARENKIWAPIKKAEGCNYFAITDARYVDYPDLSLSEIRYHLYTRNILWPGTNANLRIVKV